MAKLSLVSLFILMCVAAGALAKEYTPVEKCGNEQMFKNVAIYSSKGLCKKLPCQFKLGEELKVEIEFKNKNKVEKISAKCKAKVLGNEVDFPVPDAENGCDHLTNAKCPVQPNTDLEIVYTVPVKPPSYIPNKISVNVKLQFSLDDQKNEMISCFQVAAKVNL